MQILITTIAFLIIFSLLILVHEFGHFYMAKRNGIKVEEFGFGLPPRIWGKKVGETIYSFNWIPFGGFVRMLGEDTQNKKLAKNPKSFTNKSLWQRTQVVVAGVVMNFLLAWLLLSIGYTAGMQPLILDGEDFLNAVREGRVELVFAADQSSMVSEEEPLQQVVQLPQLFVSSVEFPASVGPGDQIYAVNDVPIFTAADFRDALYRNPGEGVVLKVLRQGQWVTVSIPFAHPPQIIIAAVLPESPAQNAGLQEGDRVLRVNGQIVSRPDEVLALLEASGSPEVSYEVRRQDEVVTVQMQKNDEGRVGVLLAQDFSPLSESFSYYEGVAMAEVRHIEPVRYPFYQAPFQALSEIKRVSGYTAVAIGKMFGNIFVTGTVPEGVAGPVGIAQMTGVYVQEGLVALMRFTALLSLSLAVINIFPFPALDGGRFLFIVIEAVRGKPVNARFESIIHSLGFIFLLLVILLITFKDIQRLFT